MAADTSAPIRLRQPGAWRILLRGMGYLRSYWPYVAGSYAMLLVRNAITLAVAMIIRWVVDEGISVGEQQVIRRGTLGLLGLTVLRGLPVFASGWWTETASQNVAYDLRNIDDGRIVEQGDHAILVAQGGLYSDLYERQYIAWESDN